MTQRSLASKASDIQLSGDRSMPNKPEDRIVKVVPKSKLGRREIQTGDALRREERGSIKRLVVAGARASTVGIAVLDSDSRFESLNTALSRETRASINHHIGKTSREIVGELARQIEPAYENVLRTGKPESVVLTGHVRDTLEYGYWLDHCFPIFGRTGRVQQLGLFVVNITAERASREILDTLTFDPKLIRAGSAGIVARFDEAIRHFHTSLRMSFEDLSDPSLETARKVDNFRSSIQKLDEDVSRMRELTYTFISQFSIPHC